MAALWLLLALAVHSWPAASAMPSPVVLDPDKAITQFVHDAWGAADGLPDRRVTAIAQTPDGYLWVGTPQGLARFDGVRFTIFPSSRHPQIGNDDIRALLVDDAGALWIGTYGGGLSRYRDGAFDRYTTAEGLAHDIVYRISQVRSGALWIGTADGVSVMEDGELTSYTTEHGLGANRVFSVIEDRQGTTWIATYGGGLSRFRDGTFTTYTTADGLGSDLILDLHEDEDGTIWVSSYGGGLVQLRDGRFSRFIADNGPGHDRTYEMLRDRSGRLWIGTYDGGLARLRDGRFDTYTREQGLSDDLVITLFEDREGSLWVGTGGGLERFRNGKVTRYSTAEGLSHDRAYGVHGDAAGDLWIATEGGGLNRLHDGRFTAYTSADGLGSDNVVSLAADAEGTLWIGTIGAGVTTRRHGRFVDVPAARDIPGLVYAMASDGGDGMWIGTSEGLGRLRDGRFTIVDEEHGFSGEAVRTLLRHSNGDLWIGTNGAGLTRLRIDGGGRRFTTYRAADGLGGDFIFTLHEDEAGTVWIGSKDGGLSRYEDGRLSSFARPGGLPDTTVNHILEADGDLWLSTPNRLLRVARRQLDAMAEGRLDRLDVRAYGEADGIGGGLNGGSQPTGWKTADGRLWFASDAGVVSIDPSSIPLNHVPPPVYIERLLVDGQRIDAGAHPAQERTVLPPGEGSLQFRYTALSLVSPQQMRFRYRLKGFDDGWIDAGTRRTAYYTNVPPGEYEFQVAASNNDGVWNHTGASIAFALEPVFHQTWWFRVLMAALALFAVMLVHRLRMRHLRLRARALSALVAERTRELAETNAALQRISGLDSLTGVANRRRFDEMLKDEWQRAVRHGWPLSAVMIDIDDFKSFNDNYGHRRGDDCLRTVADSLRQTVARSGDLIARYGGEEFVILLPDTGPAGALAVAQRLCQRVATLEIAHEFASTAETITISAGVGTLVPGAGDIPSDLIEQADRCLYAAKRAGRNRAAGAVPVDTADT